MYVSSKYVMTHLPACPSFPIIQLKALQGVSGEGLVGKSANGILVYGGVGLGCVVVARGSGIHLTGVETISVVHYTVVVIQRCETTNKCT